LAHNLDVQPDTAPDDKAAAELQLLTMSKIPALGKGLPAVTQLKAPLCPEANKTTRIGLATA